MRRQPIWAKKGASADHLSEGGELEHVRLSCMKGVLVDHLDKRGIERPSVFLACRVKGRHGCYRTVRVVDLSEVPMQVIIDCFDGAPA